MPIVTDSYESSPLTESASPTPNQHLGNNHSKKSASLEHHRIPKGERPETLGNQHILWLWTTPVSSEYMGNGGRFVRCSKGRGSITVTPVGNQPALHSYKDAEVISCVIEPGLVDNL